MSKKVVLLGSGNVAWNLGILVKRAGHEVLQVYSRNAATATELAYELDTESTNYLTVLKKDADIYIIAVNDDALPQLAEELRVNRGVVVHTSGAVPLSVIAPCAAKTGVMYPLQSLRYGVKEIPGISFLVEGNTETVTREIQAFTESLSPQVRHNTAEQRLQMHLAAVLVNNFPNYLYILAERWCKQNGLDFQQLLPLIKETAQRLETGSPNNFQTGPAARKDRSTIAQHRKMLENDAQLLGFYNYFTEEILKEPWK